MNPNPVTPNPTTGVAVTTGRKILLLSLVTLAALPTVWIVALGAVTATIRALRWDWLRAADVVLVVFPVVCAVGLTWLLALRGLRRGWAARTGWLVGWGLAAVASLALLTTLLYTVRMVRRSTNQKAMLGNIRQLAAAEDQFTLENGYRIFLCYDDLVGPGRYVKTIYTAAGEDYRSLYPRRQGTPISVSGPGGLQAAYAVNLETAATTDGVHSEPAPAGGRFEITWKDGAPHGPFRAFHADGSRWAEAAYDHGRVAGPSWIYLKDGSRFDELDPAQRPENIARQKLAAHDYPGAVSELHRALELSPTDTGLLLDRARALEATGDITGARDDLEKARGEFQRNGMTGEVGRLDGEIARLRALVRP